MRLLSSCAVVFALAGCSLINSFDDVKPQATTADGGSTGGKGGAATGGKGGSAGTDVDASSGGGTSGAGGQAGGGSGGKGGTGGGGKGGTGGGASGAGGGGGTGGSDAGFTPGGPNGALVTYNGAASEKKLYVLDPADGNPRFSEPMGRVRAILNDGGPDPDDHWYIMEETGTLDLGVTLHVRNLDTVHGLWQEVGTLAGAPASFSKLVSFGANGKAYLAYMSEPDPLKPSGLLNLQLEVVDVTDPTKPAMVTIPPTTKKLPTGTKLGLMGDQSSVNVVIVQSTNCPLGDGGLSECNVSLAHFLVSASGVTAGTVATIGTTSASGNVDFVDDPFRNSNMIAFPPLSAPTCPTGCTTCPECPQCTQTSRSQGFIQKFNPSTLQPTGSPVPLQLEMTRFAAAAAFDVCDNVMFLTTVINDVAIFAAPLGASGTVTKQCDTNSGGPMRYDPYTHTLFRSVNTTDMQAFTVTVTPGSPPVLADKVLSKLPANFQFGATAVRAPSKPTCM